MACDRGRMLAVAGETGAHAVRAMEQLLAYATEPPIVELAKKVVSGDMLAVLLRHASPTDAKCMRRHASLYRTPDLLRTALRMGAVDGSIADHAALYGASETFEAVLDVMPESVTMIDGHRVIHVAMHVIRDEGRMVQYLELIEFDFLLDGWFELLLRAVARKWCHTRALGVVLDAATTPCQTAIVHKTAARHAKECGNPACAFAARGITDTPAPSLHYAVAHGDLAAVKALVPTASSYEVQRAYECALFQSRYDRSVVEVLLAHVDEPVPSYRTVYVRSTEAMRFLLDAGYRPTSNDYRYLVQRASVDILLLLAERVREPTRDEMLQTMSSDYHPPSRLRATLALPFAPTAADVLEHATGLKQVRVLVVEYGAWREPRPDDPACTAAFLDWWREGTHPIQLWRRDVRDALLAQPDMPEAVAQFVCEFS